MERLENVRQPAVRANRPHQQVRTTTTIIILLGRNRSHPVTIGDPHYHRLPINNQRRVDECHRRAHIVNL